MSEGKQYPMSVEDRIEAMARAANKQTHRLAIDTSRQINNVWINDDGEVVTIADPIALRVRVQDDKKKLSDMLRTLDSLVKERDEHTSA